jgi:hypothetical protein
MADLVSLLESNKKKKKHDKLEQEKIEKKEKKDKLTPWTFINQILYKSKKHPYNKKKGSAYLTTMHFSHDDSLLNIVNKINGLQFYLDDGIIYEYYMNKVPKGKRYIRWTKKTPKQKKFDKAVEKLMNEEGLSKRESIMTQKQKEKIGI